MLSKIFIDQAVGGDSTYLHQWEELMHFQTGLLLLFMAVTVWERCHIVADAFTKWDCDGLTAFGENRRQSA